MGEGWEGGSFYPVWWFIEDWFEKASRSLEAMNVILNSYNARKMNFIQDGFSAFAGVQTMRKRFHWSNFIYGLPGAWFDIAVNWTAAKASVVMSLKWWVASKSGRSTAVRDQLLSWSWIGWIGFVEFPSDSRRWSTSEDRRARFIKPVATWYAMATPDSCNEDLSVQHGMVTWPPPTKIPSKNECFYPCSATLPYTQLPSQILSLTIVA
jgi:hypothetical protein